MAVLFQNYSLENADENWVHDNEVERMSREKSSVYAKAAEQSRDTMRRVYSIITLSLHGSASMDNPGSSVGSSYLVL
jgi:FtsH-binding integral membrane protein